MVVEVVINHLLTCDQLPSPEKEKPFLLGSEFLDDIPDIKFQARHGRIGEQLALWHCRWTEYGFNQIVARQKPRSDRS